MMMMLPCLPVPHPKLIDSGRVVTEPAGTVANPDGPSGLGAAIVTGGIGRVTGGAWIPDESLNWTRTRSIATGDDPVAPTLMPNSTLNGAIDGQDGWFTGLAKTIDDAVLTTAIDWLTKAGCVRVAD